MTKTVCDICGKEMSTVRVLDNSKNMQFCISSYGRIWDICDECRVSLNRWMIIRRQDCDEKECFCKAESEDQQMADIELVIKINEDTYNHFISNEYSRSDVIAMHTSIVNGTPLPKEHGTLMILSKDKVKENQIDLSFSCQKWISEVDLSNATVAIIWAESED